MASCHDERAKHTAQIVGLTAQLEAVLKKEQLRAHLLELPVPNSLADLDFFSLPKKMKKHQKKNVQLPLIHDAKSIRNG